MMHVILELTCDIAIVVQTRDIGICVAMMLLIWGNASGEAIVDQECLASKAVPKVCTYSRSTICPVY